MVDSINNADSRKTTSATAAVHDLGSAQGLNTVLAGINLSLSIIQRMVKNRTKMKKEFSKHTKDERNPLYNEVCKRYPVARVGYKIDRYKHNLLTTRTG